MTQLLKKAWNSVISLPEEKQELIAYMILEEIQDEEIWDMQFSKSKEKLSKVANKVRQDIKKGKIQRKGFGEL